MSRLDSALKRLIEGCFICDMRYPDEFEALQDAGNQRIAQECLGHMGYRLARLSETGAWFMAHAVVTTEMRTELREDMRKVRDRLEPIVGFLEVLRLSQGRDPHVHPGDVLWESQIAEAVRTDPLLERRLAEMRDISGRITDATSDRVRRMLEQLVKEGYLVQTHVANRGFKITGKVEYLYQLLRFIAENTPILAEGDLKDRIDPQARLEDAEPETAGDQP